MAFRIARTLNVWRMLQFVQCAALPDFIDFIYPKRRIYEMANDGICNGIIAMHKKLRERGLA